MKKLLTVFAFVLIALNGFSDQTTVTGTYQGDNLIVNNLLTNLDEKIYCIKKVTVNGKEISDVIQSSTFRISFDKMGFEMGDKLNIVFTHKSGCKPTIVNKRAIKPRSTFKLSSYEIDNGYLEFETTNESSKLDFYIEQSRWGEWVELGNIEGKGGPANHKYKFKIYPHADTNYFRIKQVDYYNAINYTDTLIYYHDAKPVMLKTNKNIEDKIKFSDLTFYQLYNSFGEVVKKGGGDMIDVEDLPKGNYMLNYGGNKEPLNIKIR